MLKEFRRDRFLFLKYNLVIILLTSLASLALLFTTSSIIATPNSWILFLCILPLCFPNLWSILLSALSLVMAGTLLSLFSLSAWDLLWIPLGVFVGLQSAYLMHNAAHENIRPKWFNRVVGEICGMQQLMGFPAWAVPHVIHHQFPDDPEKDPHPPDHLPFLQFLSQMGLFMGRIVQKNYFEQWGDNETSRRDWKRMVHTSTVSRFTRSAFLLLLLGPKVFVLCFMVSKVINAVWYAHFNYFTHRPAADGKMEILNLDHNWYYKLVNATMAGVYYHKNHHFKPILFDPRKLDRTLEEPLVSFVYKNEVETDGIEEQSEPVSL
ncbi:MAG: fatty acid desaturase [Verrucomicrobiae bacterium]|nr:fatty acid desaturase [Verrucomicrobiae bacterium]